MHRFFSSTSLDIDMYIPRGDLFLQMTKVLRMQVDDQCILFDGDGSETLYRIDQITRDWLSLRGIERTFPDREPQKHITLYQALPNKYEKIEYILQKGVEVGVAEFCFFRSDRSQKLLITQAKITRFESIVREAVEQCGGLRIPRLRFESTFLLPTGSQKAIVLHTEGNTSQISEYGLDLNIGLYVGPEGGWSPEEITKMRANGFIFAHFSNRVLRTETAWVVTSFALLNA